jgi:AcrR family transcriptional regulator
MRKTRILDDKILDAATDEFGQKGFAVASTNIIAECAGVSKGSIFKRYPTKAELFYAAFERELSQMVSSLTKAMSVNCGQSPFETIANIVDWKARYSIEHPNATKVMLEGIVGPPRKMDAKTQELITKMKAFSVRYVFKDLEWKSFDSRYSKEEILSALETAVGGLQAKYIRPGLTIDALIGVRDECTDFLKIVIKGMEK